MKVNMDVIYKTDVVPQVTEIVDLYNNSEYFPIEDKNDLKRIEKMHSNADLVVTAWYQNVIVGLARSITDFSYCCYLSDLCVRNNYKGMGIGGELVRITKELAGYQCKLILHSSPNAIHFYKAIGMEQIDSAFVIKRME